MGCLEVSARCLNVPLGISAWGLKELDVSAFSSVPEVVLQTSILNKKLNITCGVVCSISNKDAYLNVIPNVVWLTPEALSGEFDIYSNVSWKID